jgi:hypothetical protein
MRAKLCWGMILCFLVGIGGLCERRQGGQAITQLSSHATPLRRTMASPKLAFEPNEGQTDKTVRFLSRGAGFHLFLTDTEAVLTFARSSTDRADHSTPFGVARAPATSRTSTVRMTLVNSLHPFRPAGRRLQRGRSNYFLGRDRSKWLTDVPQYGEVVYRDVYPGIDQVYHDGGRDLEYDFVIAPERDPRTIRMKFDGIERLEPDGEGQLVLKVDAWRIRLRKPVAYQEVDGAARPVSLRYVIQGSGEVSFETGPYDRDKPLVIDPVLTYSTYLGGSDADFGRGIAVDSSGRTVISGWTQSRDFPIANAIQPGLSGSADAFVTKLSEDGSEILFSTYLGGSGLEDSLGIAVDTADNVYVIGRTDSRDFPTVNAFQSGFGGGIFDAYIVKVSADGSQLLYASYLGGSNDDAAAGIAVDAEGRAFVTGDTGSPDFPVVNAFQPELAGVHAAFVAKVEVDGSALVYSTYFGGSGSDNGYGIATGPDGCAYVTGSTTSDDFPTMHAFQSGYSGNSDAFIAKFAASGTELVYSTYLGGTQSDRGTSIVVHQDGQTTVMGNTLSADFPTQDALQPLPAGGLDLFVTRLVADGSALVYSTYLGGTGLDVGQQMATDDDGNVYIVGETLSPDFPVRDAVQPTYAGGGDAFVTKIGSDGAEIVYSTYLGGTGPDAAIAIAVDRARSAHVTGDTSSPDFPTASPYQPASAGRSDAFVATLSERPD